MVREGISTLINMQDDMAVVAMADCPRWPRASDVVGGRWFRVLQDRSGLV